MARQSQNAEAKKGIVPRLGMSKGAWRRHGRRNRAANINRWGFPKAVDLTSAPKKKKNTAFAW